LPGTLPLSPTVQVRDSNQLRAQIQDIARNCDPPIKILVEAVGKVMAITVRESEKKPVQCREGFFWRQGASSQTPVICFTTTVKLPKRYHHIRHVVHEWAFPFLRAFHP